MYIRKVPIPCPENAIEIAIKAWSYHNTIEKIPVSVSSNSNTLSDIMKSVARRKISSFGPTFLSFLSIGPNNFT